MPSARVPPSPASSARTPWFGAALLVCAALALAGGVTQRHLLTLAAAVLLLAAWLPQVWQRRSAAALAAWAALALLLLVPAGMGRPGLALMILPVVFPVWVAWLFARTLRRGVEPLVACFIRVIEGEAQLALPRVRVYARGVTIYWVGVLVTLAACSLLAALLARPGGWLDAFGVHPAWHVSGALLAWYPEVGCWGLLAAAFAAEYLFRRWYLRRVPQLGAGAFVTRLVRCWPSLLRDGEHRP